MRICQRADRLESEPPAKPHGFHNPMRHEHITAVTDIEGLIASARDRLGTTQAALAGILVSWWMHAADLLSQTSKQRSGQGTNSAVAPVLTARVRVAA